MASRVVQQALARAWEALPAGGSAVLAVSGGVDSMVLLEAARRLAAEKLETSRLLVAHVNHRLRGAESDADEALVREYCEAHGLTFRPVRLTWEEEKPSQAACRRKREAFFRSLLTRDEDRVLYAHHADDQAETVLFRLIRGTGARGLKGMLPAHGLKLRPFLELPKEALVRAARDWRLTWREDSSNASTAYDRNWIRLELIPLIEARRPGFREKLAALAAEARAWKAPASSLDLFPYAEGVSFTRVGEKVSSAELSEAFRLGRRHAGELRGLLAKSAGRAEAEGVRFTWSAGILLAERGEVFVPEATVTGDHFSSCLGDWELGGLRLSLRRGDSVKKEFQRHRVPVFFRGAIPLAEVSGKARLVLPSEHSGAACTPSALARWWLSPR